MPEGVVYLVSVGFDCQGLILSTSGCFTPGIYTYIYTRYICYREQKYVLVLMYATYLCTKSFRRMFVTLCKARVGGGKSTVSNILPLFRKVWTIRLNREKTSGAFDSTSPEFECRWRLDFVFLGSFFFSEK